MKKALLLTILLAFISIAGFAQTDNYWSVNNEAPGSIATDKAVSRISYPKEFKLFNLDIEPLRKQLFSIVDNKSSVPSVIISLPNADGAIEQFEVYEASNFEPDLQAKFPEIRAYSGKGITDKYATLKLSISPQGIQSMVFRTERNNEFIEAYSNDHTIYSVYRSHRDKGALPWTCTTDEKQMFSDIKDQNIFPDASGSSSGTIKTLRLAQSCNGEYANYFGATSPSDVAIVLAAYNATLTRCNGVYEKDLALHLNLIANTTDVIYYNPVTDPYSPNLSQWNLQLQRTLTSVIGNANYDIGHMFGASGGGGNAGCIGCVCVNPANNNSLGKGSGITSPADGIPMGDNFDIDYVAHEVGHQLGGNHTFSMSLEGTGQNKEVGSGITIMGYAGITSYDVAPHSIDIFHETTIAQIQANMAGKTCPVTVNMTANHPPVLSPVSNYTIPISTPFALTAVATDPENDPLTYCWEQNDNSTTSGANSVAYPTKATGPNWLSFPATVSGTRTFPQLSTILAGLNVTPRLPGGDAVANIEALSSVSRTLNFRVTVRDNNPYQSGVKIGQTAFTDVVVTVSNTSGPFAVTSPNTNITWTAGSSATVTWDVNNTTASPVNCANVKISLSTDGGQTFPTVLLASTPNDGTQSITVPATPSSTCRVKVEAVGNIFFDISNANFTITGAAACGTPTGLNSSEITTSSATVSWSSVSGALSYDVDYKLSTSGNWTNAATATTATSVNLSGLLSSSLYDWRVRANCSGSSSGYATAQFTTTSTASCNPPTGLSSSNISSTSADVSWNAVSGAANYDVDYSLASNNNWTNVVTGTTSTSTTITGLTMSTQYDWRVRANCTATSQTSDYSEAQFTTTAPTSCPGIYDVSGNGTISGAALIPFNTNIFGLISQSLENDHYRFVIITAGSITMTLTQLPANYNLRLLSSAGSILATSANNGPNNETINATLSAGTYYARVYPAKKNDWDPVNCYNLRVDLGTATRNIVSPDLTVFPNPVTDIANLVFTANKKGKAEITVTNQLGAVVLRQIVAATEGKNTRSLDVNKLSNGLYIIRVITEDKTEVVKIIIAD